VSRFADGGNISIVQEYFEAETGKGADALDRRPELAAINRECERHEDAFPAPRLSDSDRVRANTS
jgi:hypothetical protein